MFLLFVILNLKFKEKITKIDILCITDNILHGTCISLFEVPTVYVVLMFKEIQRDKDKKTNYSVCCHLDLKNAHSICFQICADGL